MPNRRCAAAMARMPVERRLFVEQHVAAAIDLDVDEAGREPDSRRAGFAPASIAGTSLRGMIAVMRAPPIIDRGVAMHIVAVEHIIRRDGVPVWHLIVCVSLFADGGGRSTSVPRRAASRIASA